MAVFIKLLYNSFNTNLLLYTKGGFKMISEQERQNMVRFLVMYFGSDPNQLKYFTDGMLESTYEFAYTRTLMECDF